MVKQWSLPGRKDLDLHVWFAGSGTQPLPFPNTWLEEESCPGISECRRSEHAAVLCIRDKRWVGIVKEKRHVTGEELLPCCTVSYLVCTPPFPLYSEDLCRWRYNGWDVAFGGKMSVWPCYPMTKRPEAPVKPVTRANNDLHATLPLITLILVIYRIYILPLQSCLSAQLSTYISLSTWKAWLEKSPLSAIVLQ